MANETASNARTRERILESAAEVFAEKGFEKATIREIVTRAHANQNAVNYYFHDKHSLYVAVFEHAHRAHAEQDRAEFEQMQTLPPDERLRAAVRGMLLSGVMKQHAPWHARLMVREMTEPTGVLDAVVDRLMRPRFNMLVSLVRDLAPPGTSELRVKLGAEAIVAQCLHLTHAKVIVSQLIPELSFTPEGIEAMVKHIAAFSLAALRNLPREGANE